MLVLGLATLVVGACGSADPSPRSTAADGARREPSISHRRRLTRDDAQLARASLATPAELLPGARRWRSLRSRVACGSTNPFAGATATARTPRYHLDAVDLQETVAVFQNRLAATRAFRLLHSAAELACFRRRLRGDIARRARAWVGAPRVQVLTLEPLGPADSFAQRMTYLVERGPGSTGDAYIDLFQGTAGRSVLSLVMIAQNEPLSQATDERLAQNVSRQLRQAGGNGGLQ